jgi:hypothetical protein
MSEIPKLDATAKLAGNSRAVANFCLTATPVSRGSRKRNLHARGVSMSKVRTRTEARMTSRRLRGLALGILAICVLPVIASMKDSRTAEPWPRLLASEPANVDRDAAMLQLRAHLMLDRLKQSAPSAEEPL